MNDKSVMDSAISFALKGFASAQKLNDELAIYTKSRVDKDLVERNGDMLAVLSEFVKQFDSIQGLGATYPELVKVREKAWDLLQAHAKEVAKKLSGEDKAPTIFTSANYSVDNRGRLYNVDGANANPTLVDSKGI